MMRPELLSSQPKQLQHKPGAAGALHKVSRSQPKSTAVGTAAADVHRSLLLSMLTQGSPACQLLRHLIVKHRANHGAAGSSKSQRGCTNTWMSSEHLHSPPLPTQPPSGHLPLLRAAQLPAGHPQKLAAPCAPTSTSTHWPSSVPPDTQSPGRTARPQSWPGPDAAGPCSIPTTCTSGQLVR